MGKSTINDVARLAGVSKKTVSRVINRSPMLSPETRAKVEAIIAELGYVPNPQARALALRRNFVVALIHDGADSINVFPVQQGVLDAIAGSDYALTIHRIDRSTGKDATEQMRDFLERHRPAGVITLPSLSEDHGLFAACRDFGTPSVHICSGPWEGQGDCVASLDREATAEAVRRLHALGHRRIGLLAGQDGTHTTQQRELGYLDALAELGLDRGPALVAAGGATFAEDRAAADLLLDVSPAPEAIVTTSPWLAIAVLQSAYYRGIRIPAELSIIGFFTDSYAERFAPPLGSIEVPYRPMARTAAARLCGLGAEGAAATDGSQHGNLAEMPAPSLAFRPVITIR